MQSRLFGTDGVRGPAGVGSLSPPALARLGLAVARLLADRAERGGPPRALIGRDTRRSGPAVAAAVTSGLLAGGVEVHDGGVLPTPAVALLVRKLRFEIGVVISASHNPWQDNGVKLLGPDGRKFDDDGETAIEAMWRDPSTDSTPHPDRIEAPVARPGAVDEYVRAILAEFRGRRLLGLRVVVDAANGAQSEVASRVLRRLGARVTAMHDRPDGRNINEGCGALHPESVRRAVRASGADAGVAFDGDADRVQLCDERGRLLDGDVVLAALAPRLRQRRRLPHNTVVGTSMTNGALEQALAARGIRLVRTDVGDRNVVAEMARHGYGLGGEPSGHIVLPRSGLLTGDGLVVAMHCLRILAEEGVKASELGGGYRPWPLEIVSLRVRARRGVAELPRSAAAIAEAEQRLGRDGRIVVRYSGTEPKVRVMVEARRRRDLQAAMEPVVAALREEVGER